MGRSTTWLSLAVLLAAGPAHAITCYYSSRVDAWDIMPADVNAKMQETGLRYLYESRNWIGFRERGLEVISTEPSLTNAFLVYLYYLIANVGDVSETFWMHDDAELALRRGYLSEAESLALLSPLEHRQMAEVILDYMKQVYKISGMHNENLLLTLKVINEYTGDPESPFASTYPLMLALLYVHARIDPMQAIKGLEPISQQHPVRKVRFLTRLNMGLLYLYAKDTAHAQAINVELKNTYPDLWPEEPTAVFFDDALVGPVIFNIPDWRRPPQNTNWCECYTWWYDCGMYRCDNEDPNGEWHCVVTRYGICTGDEHGTARCGMHYCGAEDGCVGAYYGCHCHTNLCYCY